MEAIIFLIISSLIGYFLKSKGEDTSKTPPPIKRRTQKTTSKKLDQTMRRMEEYTRTAVQDIEEKFPESGGLKKRATQLVNEEKPPIEKKIFERAEQNSNDRSILMQKAIQTKAPVVKKNTSTVLKFPSNTNELAQSILIAEILGPPKSKR
ncbi:hypothetical protein ACWV26_13235 [Rummeliibacillus sp. JY-2-4R]